MSYLTNGVVAWDIDGDYSICNRYENRYYLPPPGWRVEIGHLVVSPMNGWHRGECGEMRKEMLNEGVPFSKDRHEIG